MERLACRALTRSEDWRVGGSTLSLLHAGPEPSRTEPNPALSASFDSNGSKTEPIAMVLIHSGPVANGPVFVPDPFETGREQDSKVIFP